MADDGSQQGTSWPLPSFYFSVDLGDAKPLLFSEVSGLDSEVQTIEYRHGDSAIFSTIKMPGLRMPGSVTLKKGVVPMDSAFLTWVGQISSDAMQPRAIVITLRNQSAVPTMSWTLTNAFPAKILHTDVKLDTGDVAIEAVEIAYETLTVDTQ